MANEIKLGFETNRTLTYAVYNPDGTEVTAPATSLPEIAATGYYTATDANIAAGDIWIITDADIGVVYYETDTVTYDGATVYYEAEGMLFQGEYLPDVVSTSIASDVSDVEDKVDTVDTNVDSLVLATGKVLIENVPSAEPEKRKAEIRL